MEKHIETWNEKGLAIKLSDEKSVCISDLRFADDVLKVATSSRQLKRMIVDLQEVQKRKGSNFTQTKTKILTNQKTNKLNDIEIDGMHVEKRPPEDKVEYTGQMITFVDQETTVRVRQTSTGTDIPVLPATTQVYTSLTLLSHQQ